MKNILVTIDDNYLDPLLVMLYSLFISDVEEEFSVYLLYNNITDNNIEIIRRQVERKGNKFYPIKIDSSKLKEAPTTNRYPLEMYYRLLAIEFLPDNLDRILYLDPDMIIRGNLNELYNMDMNDAFFAAATHVESKAINKINQLRLNTEEGFSYINTGVLLMNLDRLRKEQNIQDVFNYIEKNKNVLFLPDQDVIYGLYGNRIIIIDSYIYNMTEKLYLLRPSSEGWLNLEWVRENSKIIHYCGRNKPWNKGYKGSLDCFFYEVIKMKNRDM